MAAAEHEIIEQSFAPSWETRLRAVQALGALESVAASRRLIELATDQDPDVAQEAGRQLLDRGTEGLDAYLTAWGPADDDQREPFRLAIYGFEDAGADVDALLADREVNAVDRDVRWAAHHVREVYGYVPYDRSVHIEPPS